MSNLLVEFKDNNFDIKIRRPKNFTWVKTNNPVTEKTFVTDNFISSYHTGIAWLIEPPAVISQPYQWIKNNNNRYKYVLTYSEELLSKGQNFLYYPFGNTLLNESDFKIYEKNKLVSMMLSNKRFTDGHRFRHQCKEKLSGMVDFYGSGINGIHQYKLVACKDYMFQVVVENSKLDYYFTEKIIDCFLTGVIPIYWGTNKVLEHFDPNGIITFKDEKDLLEIINNINADEYNKRVESIVKNFELAKLYSYSEDWIFTNYNFIF